MYSASYVLPNKHNERPNRKHNKENLTTETVQGPALALESVHNVERGDSLALCMLGVGDGVTDNALEESLEHTTGLFVDHCRS
jgi:hypothetical protein